MQDNRIHVENSQSINNDIPLTTNIEQETCCKNIRRKKCLLIIFVVIILILIIVIPIIITDRPNKKIKETLTTTPSPLTEITTSKPLKWKKSGITIVGGGDAGYQLNELHYPQGICINEENNYIYIADSSNNRIMQWKIGLNNGEIVAGGNEEDEDDIHQLLTPSDVIIDKYNNNSLIICDQDNRRVVRWFHQKEIDPQIIISGFMCIGLALDKDGSLYITIFDGVLRLNQGDKNGIIVAGGNGVGSDLNQLDNPTFILVDDNYSIYISDTPNHRIMKWEKDAKEGIIFASGNDTNTLERPLGLAMDHLGQIYIADLLNHRIIRWREGDKEGEIIIGGNGYGNLSTQLNTPQDLVFDKQGNLYVSDAANNRIQKFEVDFA